MDCLLDQQDSRDTNHDSQQYLAARHAEQHSQKQYSYGDPLHDVRHHRIICFLLVQTLRANLGCIGTGLTFELYVRLPPALSGGRVLLQASPVCLLLRLPNRITCHLSLLHVTEFRYLTGSLESLFDRRAITLTA